MPRCGAYRALADVEVISGLEKLYKPDPAIYRLCEERMGLPPAKLLFFDDYPENVAAARALGWQAEVYNGPISACAGGGIRRHALCALRSD